MLNRFIQFYKGIPVRDKGVFIAMVLLIFSIYQLGIKQICGFTFYPDEFGYWATAANMMGWDWSEIVSIGSYYSYGYSVLLFPILYVTSNSIVAYQTAILINMILMCVGYALLCVVSEKIFGLIPRALRYLSVGAAILYPAWIFYMQTTMTEALLFVLFIFIVYLFICFFDRPRICTGILLTLILIYFYIVHMRTIGTILAFGITFLLWGLSKPHNRKYVFLVLVLGIIAFIGAFSIKEFVQQSIYASATEQVLSVNDYSGKWNHIKCIFTPDGAARLISQLAGKIAYLGIASLGLAYWAFAWMFLNATKLLKKLKNKKQSLTVEWLALFLLLSSLAQVGISSLFYIQGKSLDLYMNGRYIDFLVPVFIIAGIYHLYTCDYIWKNTIIFGSIHIVLMFFTVITIWNEKTQDIRGYFQIGINWMLGDNEHIVDTHMYVLKGACAGVLFLVFIAMLILNIRKKEIYLWLVSLIIFIEIFFATIAGMQYTYHINGQNYREMVFLDIIEDRCIPQAEIYYLDDGSDTWIDFIQMQLREQSIHVVTEEEWKQKQSEIDILFTANSTKNLELYSSQFDKCVEESLLMLFYNTEEGN